VTIGGNDAYRQLTTGVRVEFTFNTSDITITNQTGSTWLAGLTLLASFGSSDVKGGYNAGIAVGPSFVPFAVSVGTASDTIPDVGASFTQATLNNVVRSLAAKINELGQKLKDVGIDVR
jgi:hypothetical protein